VHFNTQKKKRRGRCGSVERGYSRKKKEAEKKKGEARSGSHLEGEGHPDCGNHLRRRLTSQGGDRDLIRQNVISGPYEGDHGGYYDYRLFLGRPERRKKIGDRLKREGDALERTVNPKIYAIRDWLDRQPKRGKKGRLDWARRESVQTRMWA